MTGTEGLFHQQNRYSVRFEFVCRTPRPSIALRTPLKICLSEPRTLQARFWTESWQKPSQTSCQTPGIRVCLLNKINAESAWDVKTYFHNMINTESMANLFVRSPAFPGSFSQQNEYAIHYKSACQSPALSTMILIIKAMQNPLQMNLSELRETGRNINSIQIALQICPSKLISIEMHFADQIITKSISNMSVRAYELSRLFVFRWSMEGPLHIGPSEPRSYHECQGLPKCTFLIRSIQNPLNIRPSQSSSIKNDFADEMATESTKCVHESPRALQADYIKRINREVGPSELRSLPQSLSLSKLLKSIQNLLHTCPSELNSSQRPLHMCPSELRSSPNLCA